MASLVHPLDRALNACIEGRPDRSEEILRKEGDPNDPRVKFNLGWHELRHGNFQKGMKLLDAGRWINCYGGKPLGAGTPIFNPAMHTLKGKTVVLYGEHGGFGDQISLSRFASVIAERGGRVVLACSRALRGLLSRIEGVSCTVSEEGAKHILHDYWIPMFSAAWLLGLNYKTLPSKPYIPQVRLRYPTTRLKVGIRWLGNPQFEHEQHREFPPELMFDLVKTFPEAEFFSFQRDQGAELIPQSGAKDLRPRMSTWEGTAEALGEMDLVISSCTSVAHCAAAIGVPTWVVIPIMPYYTWAWPGGDSSAWYDSVRLFRQKKYGEWEAPFKAVKRELGTLLRSV